MAFDYQDEIVKKTDEELLNIYTNEEDYQPAFIKLVLVELNARKIDLEKIEVQKKHKREHFDSELEKGKKGNLFYIVLFFISAFLGGILGIIAGYIYSQSKKENSAGIKKYVYDKDTRQQGMVMMIIGGLVFILAMIWQFSE